jgi:hypothetical protein
MLSSTEFVVEGFTANVCEAAELRHRVLNGDCEDLAFEVTKLTDSKGVIVVSDAKWAPGKIGEIDCQMRGVQVAGAKAHDRMRVTIKEISNASRGFPPYL